MPSSVYVETSVISYLTARQSQDVIVAARQAITRYWWQETRHRFEVYLSMLVVDEAGAGDAGAAAHRAQVMAGLPILELTEAAQALALLSHILSSLGGWWSRKAQGIVHIA